jgi:hypothetical protein
MSHFIKRIGDYVKVDPENRIGRRDSEGGLGFIEAISPGYNVRYLVPNRLSPNVNEGRIHSARIATTGRRKGRDGGIAPSMLDHTYPEYRRLQDELIAESVEPNIDNCRVVAADDDDELVSTSYLLSRLLDNRDHGYILDIIDKMNYTNEKGWLRINESILRNTDTPDLNTHLLPNEKDLVVKLIVPIKLICYHAIHKIGYTWGISIGIHCKD